MSQFKVGDHVIVVDDSDYGGGQAGLTGVVQIIPPDSPWIHIIYDSSNTHFDVGETNTYKKHEIEHSIIHNSPLYKALS